MILNFKKKHGTHKTSQTDVKSKLTWKSMNPRGHLRFPLQKQQPVRGSSEVFDSSELISCLRNRAGHILDHQKLVVPHLLSKGLFFPSDIFSIFKK